MDPFVLPHRGFLYTRAYNSLMTPSYQTPQEAAVAQLLDSLPLCYRYQWVLRHKPSGKWVFDFFIQGALLLECSSSKNCPSKAVNWLYKKAVLVDQRFWVVKHRFKPPPFTVFFFDAPRALPDRIRKAVQSMRNIGDLMATDKVFVSVPELKTFLTKWCIKEGVTTNDTDNTAHSR